MLDKVFLDSNIVIYLYSHDEILKKEKAEALFNIPETSILITQQVLGESASVFIHKFKVTSSAVMAVLQEVVKNTRLVWNSEETIFNAVQLQDEYAYSFWDSLIIASALENDCHTLYSEDLQHGQLIEERLTIVNPFIQ